MNTVHIVMGGKVLSKIIENPKQLIMDAAKEILYNQGYHKLSMRALAKSCGIALGTIYNYYPAKKDLIIEMMADYWQNYLDAVHDIAKSKDDLYTKLKNIFNELEIFIERFRQYWLTPEFYDSPEYVDSGLKKEYVFMEKLIVMVEDILVREQDENHIQMKQGTYETASFILMNFITMVQLPFFKYESFELFLKELFK